MLLILCHRSSLSTAAVAVPGAEFGRGQGPIYLDSVQCTGAESSLVVCEHRGVGIHNCGHYEDAGVRCLGKILTILVSYRRQGILLL